eukprot:25806-Hanusia_phi.AAC.1
MQPEVGPPGPGDEAYHGTVWQGWGGPARYPVLGPGPVGPGRPSRTVRGGSLELTGMNTP